MSNFTERELLKQIISFTASFAEMKAKVETLENENKFLRSLLKDKLSVGN